MKAVIIIFTVIVIMLSGGIFVYQLFFSNPYAYSLAEFIQKQQTFSPYTKYDPSLVIDEENKQIHYVFKAMDDNDIWQIWTAASDLDGNNFQAVQQTTSSVNKQRPVILLDKKNNLLYYFYRTGNPEGAAEQISRRLFMAKKLINEEKWSSELELIGNNGIDDTIKAVLDESRNQIILAYTKNEQITTGHLDLTTGILKEKIHTNSPFKSFIPDLAYDETEDTIYLVFPRGKTTGFPTIKDLWLASLKGDGATYQERQITQTEYDNTWPFVTLDKNNQKIYLSYTIFVEPAFYSHEGVRNVIERMNVARVNLDGTNFEVLRHKNGFRIFGVDRQTGEVYGLYQEPKPPPEILKQQVVTKPTTPVRYFVIFQPEKKMLKSQLIPSGDYLTYYDAQNFSFDPDSHRIFGSQQVCRNAGNRGIECQLWTYQGRVLKGSRSKLPVQTTALMAPAEFRPLAEFKIFKTEVLADKFKINTNRKISMPVEIKIYSHNQQINWQPNQLYPVDNDKGLEIRLNQKLDSYQVEYKLCALSDPAEPECLTGLLQLTVEKNK